mgnify:CR=1 FL=1
MVAIKEISKASKLILETVPVSPVLTSQILDREFGCSLYFKCENLQPVGSFKARGAINAIGQLTNEELKRGVVTHSSGNHARALAWAAAGRGTPCYVVMPEASPAVKVQGTRRHGAIITAVIPLLNGNRQQLQCRMKAVPPLFIPTTMMR